MESIEMSVTDKVFQQFGVRLLHMACWTRTYPTCKFVEKTDSNYHPSPDWVTVRACRLVSTEWNNLISAVFRAEGKPQLIFDVIRYPPAEKAQMQAEFAFEVLSKATNGLLTDYRKSPNDFPPVKLALPISVFYMNMTGRFINLWEGLVRFLVEIDFDLPADASINLSGFLQPMENLKKVKFGSTGQKIEIGRNGGYSRLLREYRNHPKIIQSFLSAAKNVTSFTLHHSYRLDRIPSLLNIVLPAKVEFLDVPLVNNDSVAGQRSVETGCDSLKHLIIRSPTPPKTYKGKTPTHIFSLMKRHAPSLEVLELAAYANDTGDLEMSRYAKLEAKNRFRIGIKERMPNLHTLKVQGACWEIFQMESYQRNLPALKNLKLIPVFRPNQIEPLYKSKSETVESLMLCCLEGIPIEMIRGFSMNFPTLKKLCVVVMKFDASLKVCFREFRALKVLHVLCGPDDARYRGWLSEAISGVPAEEQNALTGEQITLSDVMERHGKSPSLRNLKDLEEFKLLVKDQSAMKQRTDVSVMVRTTFFQMPKLKRVILSVDTLQISEYQNQYIRKENVYGLKIEWHYSHRFEEYHELF
ncbi:unnamed protein product [Orchesella dallaii]|uniref:Uncharacterized protein n=1 Tax=Orchesella dallaii TaxID=48710 RepID=A0ABP1RRX2_9HEXA